MKTCLKIGLIVLLVLVALKLSPLFLLAALGGLLLAGVLGTLGLSLAVGLLVVALSVVAVLSPIWIPVLLVIGFVALIRKTRQPAVA